MLGDIRESLSEFGSASAEARPEYSLEADRETTIVHHVAEGELFGWMRVMKPAAALMAINVAARRARGTPHFFAGTLPPSLRASDKPIAIACLRLVTFLPERPLLSLPDFSSCSAAPTFSFAF